MGREAIIWTEEDGQRWLGHRNRWHDGPDAPEATLEELADLCDQDAEGANAHDFVGAHRLLSAMLYKHVGREKATAIMRDIAELGGLDGMNGICGADDAFKEMGVAEPWKDWKLGD